MLKRSFVPMVILATVVAAGSASAAVVEVGAKSFDAAVLKSKKLVLVDFWAPWCGWCVKMSPVLEQVAREQPDIKVVRVNVDENEALAERYKITGLPTLKFFRNGAVVGEVQGFVERRELSAAVRNVRDGKQIASRGGEEGATPTFSPYPRKSQPK